MSDGVERLQTSRQTPHISSLFASSSIAGKQVDICKAYLLFGFSFIIFYFVAPPLSQDRSAVPRDQPISPSVRLLPDVFDIAN